MSHRAFVAASVDALAGGLSPICEAHDVSVVKLQDDVRIVEELKQAGPDICFLELNLLEGYRDDLIARIRKQEELRNLFIAVYAFGNNGNGTPPKPTGADALIPVPFAEPQVTELFKRAFSLPKRVLLLSGDPQSEFAIALKTMGYGLSVLPSGEDFLNGEVHELPDFVVAEHDLPGMNGVDFSLELKQRDDLKEIPVIIAYDSRDAPTIEKIIKSEVTDILLSPFASPRNLKKIQDRFPLPPKGRRLKALVVDDSPTIRDLIANMFKELGYEVATAGNGFEGFKAVRSFEPDIITSDYDMPVLNGWEFCTEIRDCEEFKNIPIIMITTRATELDMKKGELLGVSAYLTKPFETKKLKVVVEEAIANARNKKEQEAIAKFVAADTLSAVSEMVDGSKSKKGEDKFITVLFSDICAFSRKCERFTARKIIKLLNSYFDLMVGVLSDHDAIIDKFIGDAIVARFDSGNQVTDAKNAVFSAWHMLTALNEYNEESFEEIQIRIGINSGNVILGNLGCEKHRLEYAMIGDNVNIGQRLESSAPTQGCMISSSTYELVKDFVKVGEMQEIEVKGKQEPVRSYVVLGLES
jgi:adenylate cyclase